MMLRLLLLLVFLPLGGLLAAEEKAAETKASSDDEKKVVSSCKFANGTVKETYDDKSSKTRKAEGDGDAKIAPCPYDMKSDDHGTAEQDASCKEGYGANFYYSKAKDACTITLGEGDSGTGTSSQGAVDSTKVGAEQQSAAASGGGGSSGDTGSTASGGSFAEPPSGATQVNSLNSGDFNSSAFGSSGNGNQIGGNTNVSSGGSNSFEAPPSGATSVQTNTNLTSLGGAGGSQESGGIRIGGDSAPAVDYSSPNFDVEKIANDALAGQGGGSSGGVSGGTSGGSSGGSIGGMTQEEIAKANEYDRGGTSTGNGGTSVTGNTGGAESGSGAVGTGNTQTAGTAGTGSGSGTGTASTSKTNTKNTNTASVNSGSSQSNPNTGITEPDNIVTAPIVGIGNIIGGIFSGNTPVTGNIGGGQVVANLTKTNTVPKIDTTKTDTGTKVPDTGTKAPDTGTKAPDTGTKAPDTGTKTPDTGTKAPDTGTKAPDTGTKAPDTGTKTPDTGTKAPDTGTKAPDTGTKAPDTGTKAPDTGTKAPDTGTKAPDTGTKAPDTGTKTPDTGTKTPDTGTKTPDTGTKAPDTGTKTDMAKSEEAPKEMTLAEKAESAAVEVGKVANKVWKELFGVNNAKAGELPAPGAAAASDAAELKKTAAASNLGSRDDLKPVETKNAAAGNATAKPGQSPNTVAGGDTGKAAQAPQPNAGVAGQAGGQSAGQPINCGQSGVPCKQPTSASAGGTAPRTVMDALNGRQDQINRMGKVPGWDSNAATLANELRKTDTRLRAQGIDPDRVDAAMRARGANVPAGTTLIMAYIESGGTGNCTGKECGIFQFNTTDGGRVGLGNNFNPNDPYQNTKAFENETVNHFQKLGAILGRDPNIGELYITHQQVNDAVRMMANPNGNAVQTVGAWNKIYPNLPKELKYLAGSITGGQFVQVWAEKANSLASIIGSAGLANGQVTPDGSAGNTFSSVTVPNMTAPTTTPVTTGFTANVTGNGDSSVGAAPVQAGSFNSDVNTDNVKITNVTAKANDAGTLDKDTAAMLTGSTPVSAQGKLGDKSVVSTPSQKYVGNSNPVGSANNGKGQVYQVYDTNVSKALLSQEAMSAQGTATSVNETFNAGLSSHVGSTNALNPYQPASIPLGQSVTFQQTSGGIKAENFISGYGFRTNTNSFHAGNDYTGKTQEGTRQSSIIASGSGKVLFAGTKGGYGNVVDIDHGNGVVTRYAHLDSIGVTKGQTVNQGQQIGVMGSTGHSEGTHLHYEIREGGYAVDPLSNQTATMLASKFNGPAPVQVAGTPSGGTTTPGGSGSQVNVGPAALVRYDAYGNPVLMTNMGGYYMAGQPYGFDLFGNSSLLNSLGSSKKKSSASSVVDTTAATEDAVSNEQARKVLREMLKEAPKAKAMDLWDCAKMPVETDAQKANRDACVQKANGAGV